MNPAAKIKEGYSYIIEGEAESATSSSVMYNVPNPPSDVAQDVTKESIRAAIKVHCQTSVDQFKNLPADVREKLVRK
jgi:hypothetical protein